MRTFTLPLWEKAEGYRPSESGIVPYMAAYLLDGKKNRGAVVICPGGGYRLLASHEGEAVALQYNAAGYHAFVLHYSIAPRRHPQPLMDVSRCVAMVRTHAQQWQVKPQHIAVCGFSAGGHLAASLGVHWQKPYLQKAAGEPGSNQPNALILGYPVITSGPMANRSSFDHLLGQDAEASLLHELSLEYQVGVQTPPTFLWHTVDDQSVPVENSLLFAQSLRQHGVSFEMHLYPQGPHGMSLATEETAHKDGMVDGHVAGWMALSQQWLKQLGW